MKKTNPKKPSPIKITDLIPADLKNVTGGQAPREEAKK